MIVVAKMSETTKIKNEDKSENLGAQTVQVDAAHPRFRKKYHCLHCNQNFEPTPEGLDEHFSRNSHKSDELCGLCQSGVFLYTNTGRERKYYFTCNCQVRCKSQTVSDNVNALEGNTNNDL
uniref:Putative product n=1 Tax=Xenopsylla cheopis TaxID=163159 RepID=A0A6M2DU70_XENCH